MGILTRWRKKPRLRTVPTPLAVLRRSFYRPLLEALEDRITPTTIQLGNLFFTGDLTTSDGGKTYTSATAVTAGFSDALSDQLISVSAGATYDVSGSSPNTFTLNGTISEIITGTPFTIIDTDVDTTFDATTLGTVGLSTLDGTSFKVAGVDFRLNTIQLVNGGSDQVRLQGAISLPDVAGLTVAVTGTNFVDIDASGVSLTGVTASLNGSFTVGGLTFDATNLTAAYASSGGSDTFTIKGDSSFGITIGGLQATLNVDLGGGTTNGLQVVYNGTTTQTNLDMTVTASALSGVTFGSASASAVLTVVYAGNTDFTLSGNASLQATFAGQDLNIGVDVSSVTISDGALDSLNMTVNADYKFAGVEFKLNDLTCAYANGQFDVWGSASVSTKDVNGETNFAINAAVDFGADQSSAGLKFGNGELLISVTIPNINTFAFCGLQSVTSNGLTFSFNSQKGELELNGGVSFRLATVFFSTTVKDLEIHTDGQIQFDQLSLKLTGFNLGVFSISDFEMTVTVQPSDFQLATTLAISLPGGWEAGGNFQFEYSHDGGFQLQDIGVFIVPGTEGIAIGDTGLFVTYLGASLDGLGSQNWSISGTIGIAFGPAIPIKTPILNATARIVLGFGSFTLDKDELVLSGDVALGGYTKHSSPTDIQAAIGLVKGNITLDWATGVYSADVSGTFLDGLFTFDASFTYSQGFITIKADAVLEIPKEIAGFKIPVIGGKHIASADLIFEFDYNGGDPKGFFAAWTTILDITVGIEVDITTGAVMFLGKDGVAAVEQSASQNAPQQYFGNKATFTVPATATGYNFNARWTTSGDTAYVVLVRGDESPSEGGVRLDQGQGSNPSGSIAGIAQFKNTTPGSSEIPPGQDEIGLEALNLPSNLPAGTYTLYLFTTDDIDPNAIVWTGTPDYSPGLAAPDEPTISNVTPNTVDVTVTVTDNAAFAGHLKGTLYRTMGETNGIPLLGSKLLTTVTADDWKQTAANTFTATAHVSFADAGMSGDAGYQFYFIVSDGFNPSVTTPMSGGPSDLFIPNPPLMGNILDIGDNRQRPLSGVTMFLVAGALPGGNNDFLPLNPVVAISDRFGSCSFYDGSIVSLEVGQDYTLVAVLPSTGYTAESAFFQTFTYTGTGMNVTINVSQQTTIAGTVFNDLNDSGVANGNPPVGGVGVNLYLPGDPLTLVAHTATLANGSYEFVGVDRNQEYIVTYVMPANYVLSPMGKTSYDVTVGGDGFKIAGGNDFAIIKEATISGIVTGQEIFAGELNPSSARLVGWTIELLDATSGDVVATTTTSSNGTYVFKGVAPGNYKVRETPPQGWSQAPSPPASYNVNQQFAAIGSPTSAVAVGDFNNDGNLDYAVAFSDSTAIDYYLGTGNGSFSTVNHVGSSLSGPGIMDLQTGNFNGDSYTDLIALDTSGNVLHPAGNVAIMYGSASGLTNGTTVYVSADQDPGSQSDDFGNDIETSNYAVYGIAVTHLPGTWDGSGKDGFAVYGQQQLMVDSQYNYYSYFVDACSPGNGFTPVRLVGGPNSIATFDPGNQAPWLPLSGHALAIGDLNNDGNLDLFLNFATGLSGAVDWIAYGNGQGQFGQQQNTPAFLGEISTSFYFPDLSITVPGNCGPMALGDVNGDGLLDAVVAGFNFDPSNPATHDFTVLQQKSIGSWVGMDGNFASGSSPQLPVDLVSTAQSFVPSLGIADVNDDGKADITYVGTPISGPNAGMAVLVAYFNQGNTNGIATFTNTVVSAVTQINLASGARPNSMALGDYNNDGQVDYIVGDASYSQGGVTGGAWRFTNTTESVTTEVPVDGVVLNGTYTVNFSNFQTGTTDEGLAGTIATVTTTVGQALANVVVAALTRTTGENPTGYTVTINWGDGTTSAGTVVGGGLNLTITGSHTYTSAGLYFPTVTVTQGGPRGQTVTIKGGVPATVLPDGLEAPASGLAVVAANGLIYAIGGFSASGTALNTIQAYDPTTGTWITGLTPMPIPLGNTAATVGLDGKIYVMGGVDGPNTKATVEIYDPTMNQWSFGADMPTARWGLSLVTVAAAGHPAGLIYAIGGVFGEKNDEINILSTVQIYDPATNTWTGGPSLKLAVFDAAAVTDTSGRIYVIGGAISREDGFSPQSPTAAVQVYDPAKGGSWTAGPSIPVNYFPGIAGAAAVRGLNGVIYLIGGSGAIFAAPTGQYPPPFIAPVTTIYAYDPESQRWVQEPNGLATAAFALGAAVDDQGRIYAIGGFTVNAKLQAIVQVLQPGGVLVLSFDLPAPRSPFNALVIDALSRKERSTTLTAFPGEATSRKADASVGIALPKVLTPVPAFGAIAEDGPSGFGDGEDAGAADGPDPKNGGNPMEAAPPPDGTVSLEQRWEVIDRFFARPGDLFTVTDEPVPMTLSEATALSQPDADPWLSSECSAAEPETLSTAALLLAGALRELPARPVGRRRWR